MKGLNLFVSSDSARGDELLAGGCPQFADRFEWKAFHQTFGVNVRVKERAARLIQRFDDFERCDRSDFLPSTDGDLAAPSVDCKYKFLLPELGCELLCKADVDRAVLNQS